MDTTQTSKASDESDAISYESKNRTTVQSFASRITYFVIAAISWFGAAIFVMPIVAIAVLRFKTGMPYEINWFLVLIANFYGLAALYFTWKCFPRRRRVTV